MTDKPDLAPVPVVAVPHACSGPSCDFCEWSNPALDLPELPQRGNQ